MSLTPYPEGSLRELWKISLPLMLSSFSVLMMITVDRLMLAHYSTEALNAAVVAATFGWAFLMVGMVITSISEVFVAQHNGAGRPSVIGQPVWQMLWLSLFSILFYYPLAVWGASFFYGSGPDKIIEKDYFRWMMFFGPSFAACSALFGFYVGRGKTALVTSLSLVANFLNVGLDYLLIFGVEGWFPSLGPKGAAIATSWSSLFQVIVLGAIFLKKSNRMEFGTGKWEFRPWLFFQCIKIGGANALFNAFEVLGWAAYYHIMTLVGKEYITVGGICQSVVIVLFFYGEGISKGATAVAGNLIGARKSALVNKVFHSGMMLHLCFLLALGLLFVVFSEHLLDVFLPYESPEAKASIYSALMYSLVCMVWYMFFEGVRLLLTGLLTAAGDTNFLLVGGTLSVWLLLVLPTYYFVAVLGASIETSSTICVIYSAIACVFYSWRFYNGRWRGIHIVPTFPH